MAPSDKASVGRRVSSFLGLSGNQSDNPQPTDPRPVSRGRQAEPAKLRKSSLPWLHSQNSSQQHLPPSQGSAPGSANHSAQHSLNAASLDAPRAPFARDASSAPGSRSASPANSSRNASPGPNLLRSSNPSRTALSPAPPQNQQEKAPPRRKSWMPLSKNTTMPPPPVSGSARQLPGAWIAGKTPKIPYDVSPLVAGNPVPELWDEAGDVDIYLFPESSGFGPSFRTHGFYLTSSTMLTELRLKGTDTSRQGSFKSTPRYYSRTSSKQMSSSVPAQSQSKSIEVEVAQAHGERQLSSIGLGSKRHAHARCLSTVFESANLNGEVQATQTQPDPPKKRVKTQEDLLTTRGATDDNATTVKATVQKLFIPILSIGSFSSASSFSGEVNQEDVQALLDVRNMFAFLIGQALVATDRRPAIFHVFLKIAESLSTYDFSNIDGSTFGEVAVESFNLYINELELRDVRSGRETNIEMLLLAEKMRSEPLYREAFIHAAGRYNDIQEVLHSSETASGKYEQLLISTRKRLELASIDLNNRMRDANGRLEDFNFPMLFSGIMNSKTADERKFVNFDGWRSSFMAVRKHVLNYYKDKYGSWPPKASAKKNNLTRSGLSRPVMQELYRDFSGLYDLLVDRATFTNRDNNAYRPPEEKSDHNPVALAMWRVLDEYDRSTPPVQPPVPFDIPMLPSFGPSAGAAGDAKKEAKQRQKKLKEADIAGILRATHNPDTRDRDVRDSPFLRYMIEAEFRRARDSSLQELIDQRAGFWIFIYSVLQALPMVVIDAPGVMYDRGVEYHLCEADRESVPWAVRAGRSWYKTEEDKLVALPLSAVELGVLGTYQRSHCWVVGRQWSQSIGVEMRDADPAEELERRRQASGLSSRIASHEGLRQASGLSVPGSDAGAVPGSRSASKDRRGSALSLGLESLPIPHGISPFGHSEGTGPGGGNSLHPGSLQIPRSRPVSRGSRPSTRDGSQAPGGGKSFDDIIADMNAEKASKEKNKKKK